MDRTKAHDARRPFAVRPYLLNSPLATRSSRRLPRRTWLDRLSFWSASATPVHWMQGC